MRKDEWVADGTREGEATEILMAELGLKSRVSYYHSWFE